MRRKTKKNLQTKKVIGIARIFQKKNSKTSHGVHHFSAAETRFRVSLVVLMALLSISAYLLALVLAVKWAPSAAGSGVNKLSYVSQKPLVKKIPAGNGMLNDASLDFKLTIPKGFGDWIYQVGYVKDLIDDSQSNQYVKIYLPLSTQSASAKFSDKYQNVLTIVKFGKDSWNKLEKGCQKGNSTYCDQAGTKLAENDQAVFAYVKADNCPKEIQAQCKVLGNIIDSFQLK